VDYWVIAHHSQLPGYSLNTENGIDFSSLKRLSLIPAIFTYGFFPYFDDEVFESKFYIYDKNLNLIKTFEYQNKTSFVAGWFVFFKNEDEESYNLTSPTKSIYEPDVKELTKEIYTMIKK
jgi:hypothetical protein